MLVNDELESQVISFLRFPLIVAVVFIHSNPSNVIINDVNISSDNSFAIYENFRYFISEILARVAVPLYFFISGFLFYKNVNNFDSQIYFQKLCKRGRTLLIPYMFWNLIVLFLFYLTQTFLSGLTSGNNLLITEYSWENLIKAFWNGNSGNNMPINYPLWFLRDLMVTVILSPVIYWLIQHLKILYISLLGVLWFFNIWFYIPGISITAIFFFSFGAYFSLSKKNYVETFLRFYPAIIVVYLFVAICNLVLKNNSLCIYIHNMGVLIGVVAFISLTAYCINRKIWHINFQLSNSSFFIYVYHGMPLALVIKSMSKILQPQSNITFIMLYLFSPILIIVMGYWINYFLMKYFPKFTSTATGGR